MEHKTLNYILIGSTVLIIGLSLVWYFFFSIYEIKIIVEPEILYVNSNKHATIKIIPINLLGSKVPFRKVSSNYEVVENKDLVKIETSKIPNNLLFVFPKDKTGKAKIQITSKYSLFPNIVKLSVILQRN